MPGTENSYRNTINPSSNAGISDADPPCSRKSGCKLIVSLCIVVPLYVWFCICRIQPAKSCSTVASTDERNPCIGDLHSSDPCCSRVNCIEIDDEGKQARGHRKVFLGSSRRGEAVAAMQQSFRQQVAP